jgi:glycosyltransferase involved in cell wall biosynthesis
MAGLSAVYILAKNEQANIERCLKACAALGLPTIVLDSGSTDRTPQICDEFPLAKVRSFSYRNHCESYNAILQEHDTDEFVAILDADMQIGEPLACEIQRLLARHNEIDAIVAPVEMYWDEQPLKRSSLYPPKPIVFRGGRSLFEPAGHGEHLVPDARIVQTSAKLIHDDRKPLEAVLANQWRYAKDTVRRSRSGKVTRKDRIRMKSPLMLFVTPLYALIIKRGLFDGRQGIIYAIDRLIAEALTYRASLSTAVRREIDAAESARTRTESIAATERTKNGS